MQRNTLPTDLMFTLEELVPKELLPQVREEGKGTRKKYFVKISDMTERQAFTRNALLHKARQQCLMFDKDTPVPKELLSQVREEGEGRNKKYFVQMPDSTERQAFTRVALSQNARGQCLMFDKDTPVPKELLSQVREEGKGTHKKYFVRLPDNTERPAFTNESLKKKTSDQRLMFDKNTPVPKELLSRVREEGKGGNKKYFVQLPDNTERQAFRSAALKNKTSAQRLMFDENTPVPKELLSQVREEDEGGRKKYFVQLPDSTERQAFTRNALIHKARQQCLMFDDNTPVPKDLLSKVREENKRGRKKYFVQMPDSTERQAFTRITLIQNARRQCLMFDKDTPVPKELLSQVREEGKNTRKKYFVLMPDNTERQAFTHASLASNINDQRLMFDENTPVPMELLSQVREEGEGDNKKYFVQITDSTERQAFTKKVLTQRARRQCLMFDENNSVPKELLSKVREEGEGGRKKYFVQMPDSTERQAFIRITLLNKTRQQCLVFDKDTPVPKELLSQVREEDEGGRKKYFVQMLDNTERQAFTKATFIQKPSKRRRLMIDEETSEPEELLPKVGEVDKTNHNEDFKRMSDTTERQEKRARTSDASTSKVASEISLPADCTIPDIESYGITFPSDSLLNSLYDDIDPEMSLLRVLATETGLEPLSIESEAEFPLEFLTLQNTTPENIDHQTGLLQETLTSTLPTPLTSNLYHFGLWENPQETDAPSNLQPGHEDNKEREPEKKFL